MLRILILTALMGGIAACASSQPQDFVDATTVDVADDSANLTANTQTDDVASGTEGTIEYIEAPSVEQTATVEVKELRDELICRRVHVTGSHRPEKICRYRSELDAARDETQKSLRNASMLTGSTTRSD